MFSFKVIQKTVNKPSHYFSFVAMCHHCSWLCETELLLAPIRSNLIWRKLISNICSIHRKVSAGSTAHRSYYFRVSLTEPFNPPASSHSLPPFSTRMKRQVNDFLVNFRFPSSSFSIHTNKHWKTETVTDSINVYVSVYRLVSYLFFFLPTRHHNLSRSTDDTTDTVVKDDLATITALLFLPSTITASQPINSQIHHRAEGFHFLLLSGFPPCGTHGWMILHPWHAWMRRK